MNKDIHTGGGIEREQARIIECKFKDIRHIFEEFHYKKGHMGGGISTCFALYIGGKLSGGAVLGLPRHEAKYPKAIDIRRMACLDSAPKNSESFFIGQIRKWVRDKTDYESILSYSDMTVGHMGTIYKASGFKDVGTTAPSKYIEWNGKTYHPRSLSIDRDYSYKMREAVKDGTAVIKTGLPKRIWLLPVTRKLYKTSTKIPRVKTNYSFQMCLV